MRKKDYRRWEYDEDAEISMEEQLTLENHQFDYDHGRDTPTSTTTFTAHPSVTVTASHIHRKKGHRRLRIKEKVQVLCMSSAILLLGFIAGFHVGGRDFSRRNSSTSFSVIKQNEIKLEDMPAHDQQQDPFDESQSDDDESVSQRPPEEIDVDNIKDILRRTSEKAHRAGTPEGKSMALYIRDLWRSYGLSVRVEQHKALLTKTTGLSYAEVVDENGSVVYRTSQADDNLDARPIIAFSPDADLDGILIYGHYGRPEDFDFLLNSKIVLNRSIALVRFGALHPSRVAGVASAYGIKGLLFYPDPQDYGPQLPYTAVRSSSLLTLGQIHDYQKHKSNFIIPAHTISPNDAEQLLRLTNDKSWAKASPESWQGGLRTRYSLGPSLKHGGEPPVQIHLRLFNEAKTSTIFNVIAAISGEIDYDRYVIVGCSHDSFYSGSGAGEPGLGLALLSELARSLSTAVQNGWKPQRSILFISWDANLFAFSGVSHWLQEHHYEISSRTIAYIDLSRTIRGNNSLHVHSSPILTSVARKAISRVIHEGFTNPGEREKGLPITFSSLLTSDEPSFAFLGNLGVPFLRICLSNSPQGFNYPLFHTSFDTFENFVNSVDPEMKGAETLGKIILETIILLSDSSVLPINVEDYVVEIQKAFGNFMAHYQEDLHKANLSIAYLQAAVMRLEVIGDNFRTEMHNRSVINLEYDTLPPVPSPSPTKIKSKKALLHRIINDKLMDIDRTFLLRGSDVYKHQVLGFTYDMEEIGVNVNGSTAHNVSMSLLDNYFPKLKEALDCGTSEEKDKSKSDGGSEINSYKSGKRTRLRERKFRTRHSSPSDNLPTYFPQSSVCHDWHSVATQRIASLTRALDAASAVLQSPLLPEESE